MMAVSIDPGFGIPAVLTEKLIDYVVDRINKSRNIKKAWDNLLDEGELEVSHDEASENFLMAEIQKYNNNENITCAAWTEFCGRKWWVNHAYVTPDGTLRTDSEFFFCSSVLTIFFQPLSTNAANRCQRCCRVHWNLCRTI